MAITSYSKFQVLGQTIITVTSDLTGDIYYHWYVEGSWIKQTTNGKLTIALEPGDQAQIIAIDTNNEDFDGPANAPAGYPARRTVWWTRSLSTDVGYYRIDFATGQSTPAAEDWQELAKVVATLQWSYGWLSPRLTDLTWTWFRVVPVDRAGNEGTAITQGPEYVVRRPDAPDFNTSFDDGTQKLTFSEAS